MKYILLGYTMLTILFSFSATSAMADSKEHFVVIEITSGDQKQLGRVMHNIENLQKTLGDKTKIEVVALGEGLKFLIKANNPLADRMKIASTHNVNFVACENTMKGQNVVKSQLLDFSNTTDSGVAEVVRREEDHWSYLHN